MKDTAHVHLVNSFVWKETLISAMMSQKVSAVRNTLEFRLDGTKINGENEATC